MIEQYAHEVVVLFLLITGTASCIYGITSGQKYYNKSNNHYNDEDCT